MANIKNNDLLSSYVSYLFVIVIAYVKNTNVMNLNT